MNCNNNELQNVDLETPTNVLKSPPHSRNVLLFLLDFSHSSISNITGDILNKTYANCPIQIYRLEIFIWFPETRFYMVLIYNTFNSLIETEIFVCKYYTNAETPATEQISTCHKKRGCAPMVLCVLLSQRATSDNSLALKACGNASFPCVKEAQSQKQSSQSEKAHDHLMLSEHDTSSSESSSPHSEIPSF